MITFENMMWVGVTIFIFIVAAIPIIKHYAHKNGMD
jgi:hypothetical protein